MDCPKSTYVDITTDRKAVLFLNSSVLINLTNRLPGSAHSVDSNQGSDNVQIYMHTYSTWDSIHVIPFRQGDSISLAIS